MIATLIAQITIIWHQDSRRDVLMNPYYALTIALVETLSVMATCTPYLRPFLRNMNTGLMGSVYGHQKTAVGSVYPLNGISQNKTSITASRRNSKLTKPDLGRRMTSKMNSITEIRADSPTTSERELIQRGTETHLHGIEHTVEFRVESTPAMPIRGATVWDGN